VDEIHLHLGLLKHWTAVILNQRNANRGDDSFTTDIGRLGCCQRAKVRGYLAPVRSRRNTSRKADIGQSSTVIRQLVNVMPLTGNKAKAAEIRLQHFLRPRKSTVVHDQHGPVKGTVDIQPPMHIRTLVDAPWAKAKVYRH